MDAEFKSHGAATAAAPAFRLRRRARVGARARAHTPAGIDCRGLSGALSHGGHGGDRVSVPCLLRALVGRAATLLAPLLAPLLAAMRVWAVPGGGRTLGGAVSAAAAVRRSKLCLQAASVAPAQASSNWNQTQPQCIAHSNVSFVDVKDSLLKTDGLIAWRWLCSARGPLPSHLLYSTLSADTLDISLA